MEKRTRWLTVLFFALAFSLAADVTNADLIAYEPFLTTGTGPFDYSPGTYMHGRNGGEGWGGAWVTETAGSPPTVRSKFIVGEGSLVHPDPDLFARITTAGNHGIFKDLDHSRALPAGTATADGRDIWFSALFQSVDELGQAWFFMLGWGSLWDIEGTMPLTMGFYNPGFNEGFPFFEAWQSFPDPTAVHWIVFKWETVIGGGDTKAVVHGWLDPDPFVEPTPQDSTYAGWQDMAIRAGVSADWNNELWIAPAFEDDPAKVVLIDEIRYGETYRDVSGYDPKLAFNPRPAAGEVDVDPNLIRDDLQGKIWWSPPEDVITPTFDVYFREGNDPCTQLENNTANTSTDPCAGALDMDTDCYWRVDVRDPNGGFPVLREGRTWTFRTWPLTPVIWEQPEDVFTPAGENVTFTVVSGGNLGGGHTYQWYGEIAGALSDVGKYSGTTTATLNISNVQIGEEDLYYCKVTNDHGNIDSDSAALILTQLTAWYKFQNNAADSAGSYNGTAAGAPGYVAGADDMAIDLYGVDEYVDVDHVIGVIGSYERLTITAWVNPDPGQGERGVVLASNGWEPGGIFIDRQPDSPVGVYIIGNTPNVISATDYAFPEGEWTFVAFVYDTDEGIGSGKLYFDGELEAEVEYTGIGGAGAQPIPIGPFSMGAWISVGETPTLFFDGKLDDVRIYAYALSPLHIASLYNEIMTGESACVEYPELDLNEDCQVNLVEYSIVLSKYLECNIVPTCLP